MSDGRTRPARRTAAWSTPTALRRTSSRRLPGIDDATTREIVRIREEVDGFSSLADLGAVVDLPADTVEDSASERSSSRADPSARNAR